MKEAFLAGLLAMGANADDSDINIKKYVVPVTVNQNGQEVTVLTRSFEYAITANDTKAGEPHITRHINTPN